MTDRVNDATALRAGKRTNQREVLRVAKLLAYAEDHFAANRARQSAGDLWKADVRAIRYVFNRLMQLRGEG